VLEVASIQKRTRLSLASAMVADGGSADSCTTLNVSTAKQLRDLSQARISGSKGCNSSSQRKRLTVADALKTSTESNDSCSTQSKTPLFSSVSAPKQYYYYFMIIYLYSGAL
jgi:hypothetical protein